MRAAFGQFGAATDEDLQRAAELGATDVLVNTPSLPGAQRWELADLLKLRLRLEQFGLRLAALENVPMSFYDHVMLNGPRRDQQIDNMIFTIRITASAGIPILGYNWMPLSSTPAPGRSYTEDELWANLQYWIEIITPIAEEEGICLGIHPCDPPESMSGGMPSILWSFAACKRLVEIYPSACNAIELCHWMPSEMHDDVGIHDKIRYFGSRDKILYVHLRNVVGTAPRFREEFANSMYDAVALYYDVGFDGFFVHDTAPPPSSDTLGACAFAIGYTRATIQAVTRHRESAGLQRGSIRDWSPGPMAESPCVVNA